MSLSRGLELQACSTTIAGPFPFPSLCGIGVELKAHTQHGADPQPVVFYFLFVCLRQGLAVCLRLPCSGAGVTDMHYGAWLLPISY